MSAAGPSQYDAVSSGDILTPAIFTDETRQMAMNGKASEQRIVPQYDVLSKDLVMGQCYIWFTGYSIYLKEGLLV